ncbi:surfeit locus protein 1 [Hyalella azteca]|uniref:SURF1-like protein n=1 Tax=Hyalella azteca TaxID=294128 RepID=A0A8B7NPT0_HYAAZ|nr:surfeit locus protein 1 [Hyalella azteca]
MLRNISKLLRKTACQFGISDLRGTARMPLKNKFSTSAAGCIQAVSSVSHRRKPNAMAYALLIIPGSAFCLGCWQVYRRQWKLRLINELQDKMALPPIELPNDLSMLQDLEYRKVLVKGTFDHSKEMLYGPRPALYDGRYKETGSLVSSGSSGFCIITPLKLSETGETILVNRGWVPKKFKNAKTRLQGQVEGEQEITGVVRLQENRSPFMAKSSAQNQMFLYRDVETMSAMTGSLPVFLDACTGVPGGPMAGQTRVSIRNEHLSYLLTWYSLSFITSFLWYRKYINPRAFI